MQEHGEAIDALNKLDSALSRLVVEYGADPAKTGIKANENGSFTIKVDKGPTFWFQDEMELATWILGMTRSD